VNKFDNLWAQCLTSEQAIEKIGAELGNYLVLFGTNVTLSAATKYLNFFVKKNQTKTAMNTDNLIPSK